MPTYEMPLLIRVMTRPEVVTTLKRVSGVIFGKGGFIRKIEHLGQKPAPYKIRAHGTVYREADYFIFHFDAPPRALEDMSDEYHRDMDIIKKKIYKKEKEPSPPCTLPEELLAPAYRPDVQKMLAMAKKQQSTKYKFKSNSGLDYYPFQK